jgi:hypothetical protein
LPRLSDRGADGARIGVERRLLVRILAVPEVQLLTKRKIQIVGERRRFDADRAGEVRGYHGVVLRRMRECLGRKLPAHAGVGRTLIRRQFVQKGAIIGGIDHHGDRSVILGGGAHHGGAADVDVLHGFVVRAVRPCDRRCERVEIDGEQIDGLDAVLAHDFLVHSAAPEKSAVDFGVERFHAPTHDFGKTGVLGHLLYRNTMANQQVGGAAGREELDASFPQLTRELDDPSLVGDAQQCAAYGREQWSLLVDSELFEFLA